MNDLVSIGIPTFNAAGFIEETLESAINQSYQNLEILVVDDGSTDHTQEIVRSFSDSRIRLEVNPKNLGPSASWNRLLEMATGKYFKVLCHDDILYPECVEKQVAAIQQDGVVLVTANRDLLDENGKLLINIERTKKAKTVDGHKKFMEIIRRGTNLLGEPHAVLVDMETVRRNGIVFGDSFFVIDIDFYGKVMRHGSINLMPETLSGFRVFKNSASVKLARQQTRLFREFVQDLRNRGDYKISAVDYLSFLISVEVRNLLKMLFYKFYVRP